MKYVEVGGARMSAIGLGTWQFGSREWGYGQGYAERDAGAIVEKALDVGISLFDTAEAYAFGKSEKILGQALRGHRDEAFIATKIFPLLPIGPVVLQRARGSLRRLGVSKLDLYQIHQDNPLVPLSSTMPAFRRLLEEGAIGHAGVSNYSLARWQAADAALGRPVLANQVLFNLVHRGPETELLPFAQAQDRLVIAYSPLAQGLLSGRYDADHRPTGAVRTNSPAFLPENLRRAGPVIEALKKVAAAHGATPSQVALAWLIRMPNVVVIPGASSVAQVEANAAAADLELTGEEDASLRRASDDFHPKGLKEVWPELAKQRWAGLAARFKG
ncbi:MAG TPA: aldo/keto reductase [Acidimicrobiales bacterium]|jgi:aryl-alcohol dehydrogenase-like predicted oxidoreductase